MDLQGIGKILILGGAFLAFLGLLLVFWQRIPFLEKLPGDIFLQKGSFQFFFPIVTCIIISIIIKYTLITPVHFEHVWDDFFPFATSRLFSYICTCR